MPNGQVFFRSATPFFGRTYSTNIGRVRHFTFTSRVVDGETIAIPIDAFTLKAVHPASDIESPPVAGVFGPFDSTAVANIVFSNMGVVRGVVETHDGLLLNSGTVTLSRANPLFAPSTPISSDSSFRFAGEFSVGTFNLVASVPHAQGSALSGAATVTVATGATTVATLRIVPTGGLTGVVKTGAGATVGGAHVTLSGTAGSYATTSNPTGQYTYIDVPMAASSVQATDSSLRAVATVVVTQDVTTGLDLRLVAPAITQLSPGKSTAGADAEYRDHRAAHAFGAGIEHGQLWPGHHGRAAGRHQSHECDRHDHDQSCSRNGFANRDRDVGQRVGIGGQAASR